MKQYNNRMKMLKNNHKIKVRLNIKIMGLSKLFGIHIK